MKLLLYMHTDRQKLVAVCGKRIMIGKAPQNTLVLDEPGLQPIHALLQYEDGIWLLRNLADPNTVTIDNNPITTARVSSGSVIRIVGVAIQVMSTDVAYEEDTISHVPVQVHKEDVMQNDELIACVVCGLSVSTDSKYCSQCGAAVYGLSAQPMVACKIPRSFILARLALLCAICGPLLLGLGWLAGIVLGIVVIARAKWMPTAEREVKFAWKAVVISCGWVVIIGIISAIVSWNIYTGRTITLNEIRVRNLLDEIAITEYYVKFSELLDADNDGISEYAAMPELISAGYHHYFDDFDLNAPHYGYFIEIRQSDENDFVCIAVPRHYRITGINSFWIDSSGCINHADLSGKNFNGKQNATIEHTRESILSRAGDELAHDLLQAAEMAYEKKAYAVCYRIITTIKRLFPLSPAALKLDPLEQNTKPILAEIKAKELFVIAQEKIKEGHIDAPLETLRLIAKLYKQTSVSTAAIEKIRILAEEGATRTITQAGTYEQQGNFDKTLALLRNVYRKYPEASVDTSLTNSIIRCLDHIQKNREKDALNLMVEARKLEANGDYISALPIYLSIKNRFPETHTAKGISNDVARVSRAVDEIHSVKK